MQLNDILADAQDQDRGREFELSDPVNGKPTGIKLRIVGPDSATQNRARLKLSDDLADNADPDGRVSAVAVSRTQMRQPPEWIMFAITAGVGPVHGLGFSFMLQKVLRVDSPNIWQSLLSFNIGVEVGQFLIILACWPLFRLLSRMGEQGWYVARWVIATPIIAIAGYWTIQRSILLVQSI